MSNRIVSMQVAPPPTAPRGALWLGTFAAVVWNVVRDLVRALGRAPAHPVIAVQESRHA
jgi:hypothetical protein